MSRSMILLSAQFDWKAKNGFVFANGRKLFIPFAGFWLRFEVSKRCGKIGTSAKVPTARLCDSNRYSAGAFPDNVESLRDSIILKMRSLLIERFENIRNVLRLLFDPREYGSGTKAV
ncbi:hypothetical protein [Beijerinckia mobilis]|uniref:hypothetical protein n=1 Tax=Beijerinckia mobilis TaxID=231434 RepID=UPI0012EC5BE4|nr:hypothetical protein [Beijerinckia mobilis]